MLKIGRSSGRGSARRSEAESQLVWKSVLSVAIESARSSKQRSDIDASLKQSCRLCVQRAHKQEGGAPPGQSGARLLRLSKLPSSESCGSRKNSFLRALRSRTCSGSTSERHRAATVQSWSKLIICTGLATFAGRSTITVASEATESSE